MSSSINYLTIRDESGKVIHPGELWSPISGCSGQNCPTKDTCWAKDMVKRFQHIHQPKFRKRCDKYGIETPFPFSEPQFHPDRLDKPLHWKKPRRIGVCFMSDLFDEQVPFDWVGEVWAAIRQSPQHQFFILTKQVLRMLEWHKFTQRLVNYSHPENIYWGVSITSQADADRMIPELLRIPGKKWISIEPFMKGPIDIDWALGKIAGTKLPYIELVIIGCHNRPKLYPCPHAWMLSIVEQCKAAGVPVWVKQVQIGNKCVTDITKFPKELQVRECG